MVQVMSVLLGVLRNADEALSEFLVQQVTVLPCNHMIPDYSIPKSGLLRSSAAKSMLGIFYYEGSLKQEEVKRRVTSCQSLHQNSTARHD